MNERKICDTHIGNGGKERRKKTPSNLCRNQWDINRVCFEDARDISGDFIRSYAT